jgi:peptide/nickel transport system permease protein
MGTDQYGRDILSRVIWGSRISLIVAFSAVGLAAIFGVFLGMVSAYLGGVVDEVIMRVMDILLSFPVVVLAIALMASLGPGLGNVIFVISLVSIPVFARITRGSILSEIGKEYVLAEKASGCTGYRLLMKHLLPNSIAPIIVQASLCMADAILYEAALSFLGVGIRPPTSSWGMMLSDAKAFVLSGEWWMTVFPGIAITMTVLCFNFLGDRLRDALDPSLRRAIAG